MDDIDMDLDLGDPVPEDTYLFSTYCFDEVIDFTEPQASDLQSQAQDSGETLELANAEPVEDKIHIRGLDELTTSDIKAFADAHFPSSQPRIEWIDDTSANLHYPSSPDAAAALAALSSLADSVITPTDLNPLQLRAAKSLPSHPSLTLTIRQAVATDRKRARAHESSRFYLLHPEHDPREQRRRAREDGDYPRPRFGDKEHRRRRRGDIENGFNANMYDDHIGGDSNDAQMRSRSRSASPGQRNGGSRDCRGRRRDYRERRRSPGLTPEGRGKNEGKELFAGRTDRMKAGKELFSNKVRATALREELFPAKVKTSKNAVSDAADLFSSRLSVPFIDGAYGDGSDMGEELYPLRSDGLAAGRRAVDDWAQTDEAVEKSRADNGFFIRGQGGLSIKGSAGISIKGTAAERQAETDKKVRELFPDKAGNKGKELFPARSRNKAADMFG